MPYALPPQCPPLAVPSQVMQHVVHVESTFNPYAIGVVGGHLVRQPRNLPEALSTVRLLEQRGFNFSLGLAQVNRYNLEKYGLSSYEQAFQSCPNLQAGSRILADCYQRSGSHWGKAFSCYYSGNFVTGYRHGYVQKIFASMQRAQPMSTRPWPAIAVVDSPAPRHRLNAARQSAAGKALIAARLDPATPSPATVAPAVPAPMPGTTEIVALQPAGAAPRLPSQLQNESPSNRSATAITAPVDAAFVF